ELLPQVNRPKIAADDKVELDGTETVSSRPLQRMSAHRSRYSATRGPGSRHVAAVAHMCAAALLVSAKVVSAEHLALFFRPKHGVARGEPVRKRLVPVHIPRQRVGLPGTDRGFQ